MPFEEVMASHNDHAAQPQIAFYELRRAEVKIEMTQPERQGKRKCSEGPGDGGNDDDDATAAPGAIKCAKRILKARTYQAFKWQESAPDAPRQATTSLIRADRRRS